MTDEQYQNRMKGLLKYIKLSDECAFKTAKGTLWRSASASLPLQGQLMSEPKFVLADDLFRHLMFLFKLRYLI